MKNIVIFIILGIVFLLNGCIGHRGQNIREVANALDQIPLGTKIKIENNCLVAVDCPKFNAKKIEAGNITKSKYSLKIDDHLFSTVLYMDPNRYFFRIVPENLFFTLKDDDIRYGCDVSLPFNNPQMGLTIFLSSNYEYKGYYGENGLYSSKDSKQKRKAAQKIFESEDMKHLRAELKWLDELNNKNWREGKKYDISPKLPFIPQSKSKNPHSFEHIKGREKWQTVN